MRGFKRQELREEQPRVTSQRKHSSGSKQVRDDDHYKKRQKLGRCQTLTLTIKPNPYAIPQLSTQFEPLRDTFSSSGRRRRQKRRNWDSANFYRKWITSSRDSSNLRDRVVVVSYNILGVENASNHPDLYFNVPAKFLEWDWRKHLICKEINHYNASILCFQEVDRFKDLDDLLQKDGFRGVYKGRSGEACDGCAIFWKDKQFTLLCEENIEFQHFGLRDNVAQLCVLKMKQEQSESELYSRRSKATLTRNRSILVGNVHVLFNPKRGDIKLGQIRVFLEKAYKLSEELGSIPVILAGDLNSIPRSALYQFMASSELDIRVHDRKKISGQLEYLSSCRDIRYQNDNTVSGCTSISRQLMPTWSDEELRLATGSEVATHVHHKLKLCSAYLGVPGSSRTRDNHGEPLATSYHSKFMGTVDYIWHTEELLPVRVLETLSMDALRRSGGLPTKEWGSDHLALVCELAFANDGSTT